MGMKMMGTKKEKVTIRVSIDREVYEALLDIASEKGKSPEHILGEKLEKLKEDPEIKNKILTRILIEVTPKDVRVAKLTDEVRKAIREGKLKYSWEKD
jgi:hypothetical protein